MHKLAKNVQFLDLCQESQVLLPAQDEVDEGCDVGYGDSAVGVDIGRSEEHTSNSSHIL